MSESTENWSAEARLMARVFSRSVPMQLAVHEIRRALGQLPVGRVLTIGMGNPMMMHHLRRGGGAWEHAVMTPAEVAVVREVTGNDARLLDWTALPFEDKSFDVVVVTDCLESAPDDHAFIHECHRLLTTDGRLIMIVRNRKRFSLMHGIRRRLLAVGLQREGYTEKELFLMLKNGFDVLGMRSYTRFLLETVDAWTQATLRRGNATGESAAKRIARIYRMAGPLYRVAFQLDALFLLTRGHRWVVVGKRRMWRARQAPVLGDGRTITEAVLSRPTD